MKPEKYSRGQTLRVFWVDSTQSAGWRYEANPPVKIEEIVSIGFVAGCSEVGINLTTTVSDGGGVLSFVSIPWEAITHIQDIPDWGRYEKLPTG